MQDVRPPTLRSSIPYAFRSLAVAVDGWAEGGH